MRKVVLLIRPILILWFLSINSFGFTTDSLVLYFQKGDDENAKRLLLQIDTIPLTDTELYTYYYHACHYAHSAGDYGAALRYYSRILKFKKRSEQQKALDHLMGAKLYTSLDNRTELEPLMKKLDAYIASNQVDSTFYTRYYYTKVRFAEMKGQFDEAMKCSVEMLNYIEASKSPEEKASIFLTMGEIFRQGQNDAKALEYYKKAEIIGEANNLHLITAKSYNNQSIIAKQAGDTLASIDYLEKSIRYYKFAEDNTSVAAAYYNLGLLYFHMNNYIDAARQFRIVINIGEQQEYGKALYYGFYGNALMYIKTNRFEDAKYYLDKAMQIAQKNNHVASVGRIYEGYFNLYNKQKQFEKALYYFQVNQKLIDSIKMVENQTVVDALEAKYQLTIKEKENKGLRLQQAERDTVIARQRLSFFIIGAILIVLFFLVALFYINLKNKKKQNSLLEGQKLQMKEKNELLTTLNDEISDQKTQLEEINSVKDSMFSIISHDLRSPISSVYMLMRMLEDGSMDYKKGLSMVRDLNHEVNQALFLLNNLLNWAHINISSTPPSFAEYNLKDIIQESTDFFATEIAFKSINVDIDINPHISVWVDNLMMDSTVQNLVSNAIKFSNEGETVFIKGTQRESNVHVTIENTGPILTKKQIDSIFSTGVRIRKGTKNERGSGLGLGIAMHNIKAMNGQLKIAATNNGTLVEFILKAPGKLE